MKLRSGVGVCAVVGMLVSVGCSGAGEGARGSDPSHSGEPSETLSSSEASPSVADPKARKALRAALVRLAQANTGHYEVEVPFGSEYSIHEHGDYQLSPLAFETVQVRSGPEGAMTIGLVGVGNDRWIRLESMTAPEGGDTPSWPCWVNYDDLVRLGEFPIDLSGAPDGQPPSAIVVASWGIGKEFISAESIEGTTDLALTLGLLGARAVVAAGVDPQAEDTVPAAFTLEEGVLQGFTVQLSDLPDAIEAAGGDMQSDMDRLAEAPGAIEARFSESGAPVEVQAPPADERLKFSSPDDFEPAMKACASN